MAQTPQMRITEPIKPVASFRSKHPVLDRFPVPADVHSVRAEALGKVLEGERPEVRDEPIHRSWHRFFRLSLLGTA